MFQVREAARLNAAWRLKMLWVYVVERVANPSRAFPMGRRDQSTVGFGSKQDAEFNGLLFQSRSKSFKLVGTLELKAGSKLQPLSQP